MAVPNLDEHIALKVDAASDLDQWLTGVDVLVASVSGVANLAVIGFICSRQKIRSSRTSHNLAVVSLALADVVIAVVVTPCFALVNKPSITDERFAKFMCKLNKYIYNWMSTAIIYSILAMMLTKYVKFKASHRYSCVTTPSVFTLSIIWFFGAAFNIWQLLQFSTRYTIISGNGHTSNTTAVRRCLPLRNSGLTTDEVSNTRTDHLHTGVEIALTAMDAVVLYALPAVVLAALLTSVMRASLWSRKRTKDVKQLVMCLAFFGLYYFCKLPLEIFDRWQYWSSAGHQSELVPGVDPTTPVFALVVRHFLESVSLLSTIGNVVVYAYYSPELRVFWLNWRRKGADTGIVVLRKDLLGNCKRDKQEAITIVVEFHD